jgi:hypothetical protein
VPWSILAHVRAALSALAALLALGLAPPATASARVPAEFLGVTADGPALFPGVDFDAEARTMAAAGIGAVRVPVFWDTLQPTGPGELLADGLDRMIAAAAVHGLAVLPVVTAGTPPWAASDPGDRSSPPRDPADYAALMRRLVARYGPRGTFWAERPRLPSRPVRAWQVWNEPNLSRYWSAQPFARRYVALLRAARAAVRGADPGARIVAAGLTNFSWRDLDAMYRAGARGTFDVAAVHPYTFHVRNVVRVVRLARATMRRHGDGAVPLAVTELSWFSARPWLGPGELLAVTEAEQAARLEDAVRRLAAARRALRVTAVYWYSWLSPAPGTASVFDYAGLRRLGPAGPVDKPALGVLRRIARELRR